MSDLKRDNDYVGDRNGLYAMGRDTKPPVYGTEVKISDFNGGHVPGFWDGQQFIKTQDPSTKSQT